MKNFKNVKTKEKRIIEQQLGREPENLLGIAQFCPFGHPLVIITHPFSKEKGVFPTTFWLSCPFWVKEISRLEDEGWVKKLSRKLKNDNDFEEKLFRSHEMYAQKRYELLEKKEIKNIKDISSDILEVIKNSGIAGIRNKQGIKCLHAHVADYLINGINPAGKLIIKKLPALTSCSYKEMD